MSAPDCRQLVDRKGGALSIRRQCEPLGIVLISQLTTIPR
jgi:hypothetical protein